MEESMSASENKRLMQDIFSELSKGNDGPFLEAMADDMRWTWMGSGRLSRTFDGKASVLNELWSSVKTSITQPFVVVAHRLIADGDFVAVEAIGRNTTPDGKTYNNKYCWVCRIIDGKLRELNEYMDTQLVTETF